MSSALSAGTETKEEHRGCMWMLQPMPRMEKCPVTQDALSTAPRVTHRAGAITVPAGGGGTHGKRLGYNQRGSGCERWEAITLQSHQSREEQDNRVRSGQWLYPNPPLQKVP